MRTFASYVTLPVALFLGTGLAYGQHGHGGGAGLSGMHGESGMHGNSGESAEGAHATPSTMASTNPGGVLDHNSHLSAKLEGLLGLSGPNALATLKTDASGFKNFGQFMAAVHVSHNLGIPFANLQAKMTGPNAVSLGKAIQALKPAANSKDETEKATIEANEDVNETS
jgi:hypothetical protein